MISTVVFDFDGTLVDSMEVFADIAADIMPKYYPIDFNEARASYIKTSGLPFFQQLEVLFPGHKANAKTAEEFERTKLDGYFERPLFDDVRETLKDLRNRGIKVVVSSNNFQELVDEFVKRSCIEMDLVLGFRKNFAKGADHFEEIAKVFEIDKGEILFVGDSLKDAEKAESFGLDFVGKEGTFSRAQFVEAFHGIRTISKLSELNAIVGGK